MNHVQKTISQPVLKSRSMPGSEKRVLLVVDDEQGPRESLNIIFREEYHILLAASGAEAVELVKQHVIDAAVLDIRMKEMSGIELLERLKVLDPAIEVIMLTGYETIETLRQALRLGAADYLSKPCKLDMLKGAVANAMERRTLSETVRANNQKLDALQTQLQNQRLQEELSRTRGEIYASIIHDINSPLTIISGFIQILNQRIGSVDRIEGKDLDMVRDRLKRITRQVTHCIDIAQRYLTFIRNRPSDCPMVWVNQVLDDVRELLMVHPASHPHQLSVQLLPQDIPLNIHSTDLMQVLLNLGINAFQASTSEHLVSIHPTLVQEALDDARLRSDADRMLNWETFRNIPPFVKISVTDNGPGMNAGVFQKIFTPYFTTKPPGSGTGLGLEIIRRLVAQAEGCIHVHSVENQGTTFEIFLPVAESPK